eukprot:COSAG01_NODE_12085_length_1803_cov_1.442488_2_plen_61_part_00
MLAPAGGGGKAVLVPAPAAVQAVPFRSVLVPVRAAQVPAAPTGVAFVTPLLGRGGGVCQN